jgi:hypothetical protein
MDDIFYAHSAMTGDTFTGATGFMSYGWDEFRFNPLSESDLD